MLLKLDEVRNSKLTLEEILFQRGYLVAPKTKNVRAEYHALKLLESFGIMISQPALAADSHVKLAASILQTRVPAAFYDNPQDTRFYTADELFLEQLVSYIRVELMDGVNSENLETFKRMPLFKKALPKYKNSEESVIRLFKVVTDEEADNILKGILLDYSVYTRAWSIDESKEVDLLLKYVGTIPTVKSRDNDMFLYALTGETKFAQMLDKKDVVKLSTSLFGGEYKTLPQNDNIKKLLKAAVENCFDCALTKKQAKFYNTILKYTESKAPRESNEKSVYKKVVKLMADNKVIEAAEELSKHGSMLERNLVWLISRAKSDQINKIISYVKVNNPIVLLQLMADIDSGQEPRTFQFTSYGRVKKHVETEYETKWRKSRLSLGVREKLKEAVKNKIQQHYNSLPKLGKIFIAEDCKKVGIPFNTSSSGKGIGVLPTSSRIKLNKSNVRTFVHWEEIYDVDASLTILDYDLEVIESIYFGNYSSKLFGDSLLFSGDDRSNNGVEYFDIKVDEVAEHNSEARYAIYSINGFDSCFNNGKTVAGYQNLEDLDTKVWNAKNIAFQMNVKGNSRSFVVFAIDLLTKELIVLNQMNNNQNAVISPSNILAVKRYLVQEETNNMAFILEQRGDIVDSPEEADFVFASSMENLTDGQVLVKPTDIEALVKLITG